MSFLDPAGLLAALLALPLIGLYVLKLRRPPHLVSSTFLWHRATLDLQANVPWQRLRSNILLILELVALGALVLAFARPAFSQTVASRGDVVVVIDESWSMQARDGNTTRFHEAQQAAIRLANQLGSGYKISVVGAAAEPRSVLVASSDAGAVISAIDGMRSELVSANWPATLSLAGSLSNSQRDARVVVLTDRQSGLSSLPVPMRAPVEIVRFGGSISDLAITSFAAVRRGQSASARLSLHNFGGRRAATIVRLSSHGRTVRTVRVSLPAGRTRVISWQSLSAHFQSFRARLSIRDDVSLDKSAWASLVSPLRGHVLLVSNGDYFLQTALAADTNIKLITESPTRYTAQQGRDFDLVVFAGVLPQRLPATPVLLADVPAGQAGSLLFEQDVTGGAMQAMPSAPASLLRYAGLSGVAVVKLRRTRLPLWLRPVVRVRRLAAVAAGADQGLRRAVFAFNLQDSDWPLKLSFPVFMQNLLGYLNPAHLVSIPTLSIGQPILIPLANHRGVDITEPSGRVIHLRSGFISPQVTSELGLYHLREPGARARNGTFAVNFFPLRPNRSPGPAVLRFGRQASTRTTPLASPFDLTWPFAVLALAALGTEWWVSLRG
ncbi:MAG: VWA domain-containing protein [Chloroflexota bacterium]